MTHGKRLLLVVLTISSLLFLSTLAEAQYRGSLRGEVTDPQGAVVSGATVTLVNTATNRTLVAKSDANGLYNFNGLEPAPYKLTIDASAFRKKVLENVRIIPEQLNALDVQLEIGQVQDAVTVSGTTEALDTQTANVSGTITANQIQSMPSFGRDVFKLAQLAPGVFGDGSQAGGNGAGYGLPGMQSGGSPSGDSVGSAGIFKTENGAPVASLGQQYQNNNYMIDGISTTSPVWGGASVITPSAESVESVKVVSNAYDAELGRFSGAQVQVTTKGGTNQYHGSLFMTAHRPGLNAYQRFNGLNNKVLRDNFFSTQLGGSVGGPIWKNKIFAFFNYETVRSPQAATSTHNQWSETPAFDKLAPSGSIAAKYLGLPGAAINNIGINNSRCADIGLTEGVNCNTIPGQGLDIGSPLKSALGTQDLGWVSATNPGVGGGLDGVADIANYIVQSTSHYTATQYNGRVDADVTAKDRIGGAIYWVPENNDSLNNPYRGYNFFHHSQINDAFTGIWNHTFSPSFLNEARVNASGYRWNEITSNPQNPVGLPADNIGNIGSIVTAKFGPNVGSILNEWTYGFKDVATKVVGRHTVKFGGDLTRLFHLQNCPGCGVPSYNFFNIWDFLNDAPKQENGSFNPTTGIPTTLRQDLRSDIWGVFVQDDFKLRRNLTLNLGLRWSYFGPLSSKQGNMYVGVPGAGAAYLTGLTVQNKGTSWNAQKNNFGPQIGFAWSPFNDDKFVVRGGYGLDYNQDQIAISNGVNGNPGLVVGGPPAMPLPSSANPGIVYAISSGLNNLNGYPANPNTVSQFGANGLPTKGSTSVNIWPSTLPTQRTHHYSLETEYELGHNVLASLQYQGSTSHNMYFAQNINALPAVEGLALNPAISGGTYWSHIGYGNYNALTADVRHRFSQQFMADASFTWAKTMDTASGPYTTPYYPFNPDLSYGRSDYNVGKAFRLYAMWQPVFFHGNNLLEKIAGGWSISGILNVHGGFPWSPVVNTTGGSLYCSTCGYSTLYPVYLGGAGTSTSNDAYKTPANFPNGSLAYFAAPNYTAYPTGSGTALPQPGIRRNSFTGPGYKDVDMTLVKGFGLPAMPVLGENARFEFRMDAYNVFNNMNLNPTSISNNIGLPGKPNASFGRATSGLAARVVTLGARFNF